MKKTDPNQIGTIGELLAALVHGFNVELRGGNGHDKKIPRISVKKVFQAVLARAQVDRAALDQEFSVDLVGEAMQIVVRHGRSQYGTCFATPLDETSFSGAGQMIVSIATADVPMGVTARTYLRRAATIERIVELTVVFGAACLHADVVAAAEESGADEESSNSFNQADEAEVAAQLRWTDFLEALFESEASSAIYAKARAELGDGEFRTFMIGLRRQVVRSDNALQRYGMAQLVASAAKYVADQIRKDSEPAHSVSAVAGIGRPMLN